MSLRPDDRSSRSRTKSASRDRSRSRSNVRAPKAPSPPSALEMAYDPPPTSAAGHSSAYSSAVTSPRYELRSPQSPETERSGHFARISSMPGTFQPSATPGSYNAPQATSEACPPTHSQPAAFIPYPEDHRGFTMGDYKDFPQHERPGYSAQFPTMPKLEDDDLAYGVHNSPHGSRLSSYAGAQSPHSSQLPYPSQLTGGMPPGPYSFDHHQDHVVSGSSLYNYQYDESTDKIPYTSRTATDSRPQQFPRSQQEVAAVQYSHPTQNLDRGQVPRQYSHESYETSGRILSATPMRETPVRKSSGSQSHTEAADARHRSTFQQASGLGPKVDRLSISGNRPSLTVAGGASMGAGGHLPPPSPLQEAYRGTYQQISPMPLTLRPDDEDEMSDLEPLSPAVSKSKTVHDKLAHEAQKKGKKQIKFYPAEEHAKVVSEALNHRTIHAEEIIETLPGLSHDDVMELRKAYKKQVKVQGKGVSLPKHLKMKLSGNFGKVAYVTALGRWESEGYWANFFYQSHVSRRELLIESLMGRTNAEIWNIKDEFKDKRYADDLVKCMEKELKADKFKTAILMALEERRQEEQDVYPPEYRNRDTEMLHRAISAEKGGESTMLEIIVRRSDAHLREVLKAYQAVHGENLAKAALKKSSNLVGEVIAHILNGVINKPARDALLLRHAIRDIGEKNKDDELRYELLISRLVRLHWDKVHLLRVRKEYYERNKKRLEDDIEEATKGDFADFMCQLCEISRTT